MLTDIPVLPEVVGEGVQLTIHTQWIDGYFEVWRWILVETVHTAREGLGGEVRVEGRRADVDKMAELAT
jgi:hypothetical protein